MVQISQIIIFFSILLVFLVWYFNRIRIRYWVALLQERGWKSSIHYDRCFKLFSKLYEGINATALSLQERKEKNLYEDYTYTYGEVTFYSFVNLLEIVQPKPGEVFYDLGSGAGKAVFIAGLVFDLGKACGIEKLTGLYNLSSQLVEKLKTIPETQQYFPNKQFNIEFIHGDILSQDISDANIVFISATCFRGEFWDRVVGKLAKLKTGTRVILGSVALNIGGYKLIHTNLHLMSWGMSTVFIYEKI